MTAALGALSAAAGCAESGAIHPEYARLRPASIAVLRVQNETIHKLDEVSTSGLLQSAVIGAQVLDIPELLRGSLEEALVRKGYALAAAPASSGQDFRRPIAEGAPKPPFDAVLLAAIESWRAEPGGPESFSMRYRLELHRVPTAEVLFHGTFFCEHHDDIRSRGGGEVPAEIRRSARRALAPLPPPGE